MSLPLDRHAPVNLPTRCEVDSGWSSVLSWLAYREGGTLSCSRYIVATLQQACETIEGERESERGEREGERGERERGEGG